MNFKSILLVTSVSVLSACGGSSSTTPSSGTPDQFSYNACESTYYTNLIGRYTGTIEYRLSLQNGEMQSCDFTLELDIAGAPLPTGIDLTVANECPLSASYTGSVVQNTFIPETDSFVYDCQAPQGALTIFDPNSNVVNPEIFYENILYPVNVGVSGPFDNPGTGAYSLNPDISATYVYLFSSSGPLVTTMVVDSDQSIKIIPRTTTATSSLTSNMIKEQ